MAITWDTSVYLKQRIVGTSRSWRAYRDDDEQESARRVLPLNHHRRRRWLLIGFIVLCVSTALAVEPASPVETASVAQGQLIAVGGGPGGAGAACFSCHGLQGQGDAGGAFPRLAGLDAHYLAKQMEDYASGARPDPVMTP